MTWFCNKLLFTLSICSALIQSPEQFKLIVGNGQSDVIYSNTLYILPRKSTKEDSAIFGFNDALVVYQESVSDVHYNNNNTDVILTGLSDVDLAVSPTIIALHGAYDIDEIYTDDGEVMNLALYALGQLYYHCNIDINDEWSISMFRNMSVVCNYDNLANEAMMILYRESIFEFNNAWNTQREDLFAQIMHNDHEIHTWDDLFNGAEFQSSIPQRRMLFDHEHTTQDHRSQNYKNKRREMMDYTDYWNIDFEGALQTVITNIFDFIWISYCPYLDPNNGCDEFIHWGYSDKVRFEEDWAQLLWDIASIFIGKWTYGIDGICIRYNGSPYAKSFVFKEKNTLDGVLEIILGINSLNGQDQAIQVEAHAWIRNKYCIGIIFGEWCIRDKTYRAKVSIATNPELITTVMYGIDGNDLHLTLTDTQMILKDYECDPNLVQDLSNFFPEITAWAGVALLPGWLKVVGFTIQILLDLMVPIIGEWYAERFECDKVHTRINDFLDEQMETIFGSATNIELWRGYNVIPDGVLGILITEVWKDVSYDYSMEIQMPMICYQNIMESGITQLISTGDPNAGFSVCFQELEGSKRCYGSRNTCSGYSGLPAWTNSFVDDTDDTAGGCKYEWKLLQGNETYPDHEYRICFQSYGGGWDNGQCRGAKFTCSGWASNILPTPSWTEEYIDDTNDRGGGCVYRWMVLSRNSIKPNINTKACRVCFKQVKSNYRCYSFGPVCSAWSTDPDWTQHYRDDTDDHGGWCVYQWRLECSKNDEHLIQPSRIQIFSAVYGPKEVTDVMDSLCVWNRNGTRLQIIPNNDLFGDTWSGTRKSFVISFGMYDNNDVLLGVGLRVVAQDTQLIIDGNVYYGYHPNLDENTTEIIVLGAAYGLADVTEVTQEKINNGAIYIKSGDDFFYDGWYGTDPTAVIIYLYKGEIKTGTAKKGEIYCLYGVKDITLSSISETNDDGGVDIGVNTGTYSFDPITGSLFQKAVTLVTQSTNEEGSNCSPKP